MLQYRIGFQWIAWTLRAFTGIISACNVSRTQGCRLIRRKMLSQVYDPTFVVIVKSLLLDDHIVLLTSAYASQSRPFPLKSGFFLFCFALLVSQGRLDHAIITSREKRYFKTPADQSEMNSYMKNEVLPLNYELFYNILQPSANVK